ncbi:helix-turn-helix domain-containing protein, partial [Streptomyces sp. NPDC059389]|uniref:helix-turn-helix transcriptional regulator n=1 Tax=Streptomyces sp. NPDC059389 TaxID=3346818 RepID=UPI00367D92E9
MYAGLMLGLSANFSGGWQRMEPKSSSHLLGVEGVRDSEQSHSNFCPEEGTCMAGMPKARVMLTVPELCEELGISSSTFYDWRQKHRAPRCIKLPNGNIRVRRVDLEIWLDEHEDAA